MNILGPYRKKLNILKMERVPSSTISRFSPAHDCCVGISHLLPLAEMPYCSFSQGGSTSARSRLPFAFAGNSQRPPVGIGASRLSRCKRTRLRRNRWTAKTIIRRARLWSGCTFGCQQRCIHIILISLPLPLPPFFSLFLPPSIRRLLHILKKCPNVA